MANSDISRIASNIGALQNLQNLNMVQKGLQLAQTRLSTGRRINSAQDDPAGLTMAAKFNARIEGMKAAMTNIGDAKSMLAVAEGGLSKVNDLLANVKASVTKGASDTLSSTERTAIKDQVQAYLDQIDAAVKSTKWNGKNLLQGLATTDGWGQAGIATFQVGADTQDTMEFKLSQNHTIASLAVSLAGTEFNSATTGGAYLACIDTAIDTVSKSLSTIGASLARLDGQEEQLAVSKLNTEAAWNRIMNADMAEEQVNASKYMILQQTSVAMLTQANQAPQAILQLFR